MSQKQGLKRNRTSVPARRKAWDWRSALLALGLGLTVPWPASADTLASASPIAETPKAAVDNSYLDGQLLYQLLLAEIAVREGQPGDAIELVLDAARRNKDDVLFRRAVQIAVEAGSGDKALAVTKTWRQAMPRSAEAVRTEVQLLLALDRIPETAEPLKQLLAMSPPVERSALISGLPRAFQRSHDKAAAADQFEQLLLPYLDSADAGVAACVALGRIRFAQGRPDVALELAARAQARAPAALPPVLLALDVMNGASDSASARGAPSAAADATASAATPPLDASRVSATAATTAGAPAANLARAEGLVRRYLEQPDIEPLVRQAYAGVLASQQRLTDAAGQLRLAAQARPNLAPLWMGLGEVELELHHPEAAEDALRHALALVTSEQARRDAGAKAITPTTASPDDDGQDTPGDVPAPPGDPESGNGPIRLAHVQLLLARAAEQRNDDVAAARWLAQVDAKDADLQVVSLRAELLARQGKLPEALAMVRSAPTNTPAEQRFKLLAEVQLLIDEKKLVEARNVLTGANASTPDDVDLLYQEAMVDERLDQQDDMERLLRRILALQPDNAQALNALGYSLADRGQRLDEAYQLVKHAHDLTPADPFIVDSLGWVEYRRGHLDEAAALLQQAYASRRDTEIAAHLGEVLWAAGKHDEAARVLRDAHRLDAANEVLKQTMARLKVTP